MQMQMLMLLLMRNMTTIRIKISYKTQEHVQKIHNTLILMQMLMPMLMVLMRSTRLSMLLLLMPM